MAHTESRLNTLTKWTPADTSYDLSDPNQAVHAKVTQPSGKILQVVRLSLSFQSWQLLIFSSVQKANRVHLNELWLNLILSFSD